MAAPEEYRQMAAVASQISSKLRPIRGEIPVTDPSAVATPFPPLKPRKMGQRCPRIGASAIAMTTQGSADRHVPNHAGPTPLPISPSNVRIPAFFPETRSTFVKPMLWLPTVRGSANPMMRETTTPKGTDPRRYPATMRIADQAGDVRDSDNTRS